MKLIDCFIHRRPEGVLHGREKVGERVAVFWDGERAWYKGVIRQYNPEDSKYQVEYVLTTRQDMTLCALLLSERDLIIYHPYLLQYLSSQCHDVVRTSS